jgi:hypothetical protein
MRSENTGKGRSGQLQLAGTYKGGPNDAGSRKNFNQPAWATAVYRYEQSIVTFFTGRRKVLSTSIYNGGYHEELTAVFNHDCTVVSRYALPDAGANV